MRRRVRVAIGVVAALAVLTAGVLFSERALQLTVSLVEARVPGLAVDGVHGRLASGLRADRVSWRNDAGVVVIVREPVAEWRLWPALTGRLFVKSLSASEVDITLPARADGATPARREPVALPDIELPVVIRIDAAQIARVHVHRGDATLVDARDVRVRDAYGGPRELSVAHVEAHGAPVRAAASISVRPSADWRVTIDANGALELDGRPPVTAGISVNGELAGELAVVVRARADGTAVFDGTLRRLTAAPHVVGRLALDGVALQGWFDGMDGVTVAGAFDLDGGWENLAASGAATVRTPDWPAAAVELDANWGTGLVRVSRLRVAADGVDGWVTADGHVDWTGAEPVGVVRARWRELHWPPVGETPWRSADGTLNASFAGASVTARVEGQFGDAPDGRVAADASFDLVDDEPDMRVSGAWQGVELFNLRSAHGRVEANGALDAWTARVVGGLQPPGIDALMVELDLVGDRERLVAESIRADGLGGRATGNATVTWGDGARVDGRLALDDVDTAALPLAWPGSLDGIVEVAVDGTRWSVRLVDGEGRVRGRVLAATGFLDGDAGTIGRVELGLALGRARASLAGELSPELALSWDVDAPDFDALVPGGAGAVAARGTLRGDAAAPALSFELDATSLRYGRFSTRRATGGGAVDLGAGDGAADATLTVEGFTVGEREFDRATVKLAGRREALALTLDASALGTVAALRVDGAWLDGGFAGSLSAARFVAEDEPPWLLEAPTQVQASEARVVLEPACWRQTGTDNTLCGELAWQADERMTARAELVGLPLQDLSRWLPTGFRYTGDVSGSAAVDWPAGGAPVARGALELGPGQWYQFVRGEPVALLSWERASVDGELTAGNLDGTAGFALVEGGRLEAAFDVPLFDTRDGDANHRPLSARVAGQLSSLDLLPAFVPDIGSVSGLVRADLVVAGTLADPRFDGTLAIEDGVTTIPRLGLNLTDLGLAIHGARSGLSLRGSVTSGSGSLGFDGSFQVDEGRLTGSSRLAGTDFRAAYTPEFEVLVSPDIGIEIDGHSIVVDGEVRVPYARIEPRDLEGQVTASTDEVLVDGVAVAPEERWAVSSRVRIVLGDVNFAGFGLAADVTGALTANDEPGRPTRGTGELRVVDGRYRAWGQELEIERGRLLFAGGPLTQPGVSVRAVRKLEDVTVGVDVHGTLREPQLQLFSDPPMPQAELMSWLVLGSPLAQTTGAEQQLLERSRSTAGLAGGEMVARELGRRLGLSDVGIDRGTTPDEAALVIGHYLSPRLYIGYGIGLFDPANSIRLRYHLHRNWTIEAETGPRADSTDLLWTIER